MNDDEIKQARALCEKATRVPWRTLMPQLLDEVEKLRRRCVRCDSSDRSLDVDFHCATCWRNLEAERDRLRAELKQLRDRHDWPYEARHHDEHHEREAALLAEVERMRPVFEAAKLWRHRWSDDQRTLSIDAQDTALRSAIDIALAMEPK